MQSHMLLMGLALENRRRHLDTRRKQLERQARVARQRAQPAYFPPDELAETAQTAAAVEWRAGLANAAARLSTRTATSLAGVAALVTTCLGAFRG